MTPSNIAKPLVSICIPTFNGEKFIKECVESALRQTYRPLEIIISDDCSTDNTVPIIEEITAATDIPITIFNHKPSTIGENWNFCVNKSNGELIKFLFQDDILKDNCIDRMVSFIQVDMQIGLLFCKRDFLIEENKEDFTNWVSKYSNLHLAWEKIKPIQNGKTLLRDKNILSNPKNKVGEPTAVLLRRTVFNKAGYFDTQLKQSLDYEFWYRVFKHFKIGFLDESLVVFRLHKQQTTIQNRNTGVDDYKIYPELVYKNLFWHLHPRIQVQLLFKYSKFIRFIKKLNSWRRAIKSL